MYKKLLCAFVLSFLSLIFYPEISKAESGSFRQSIINKEPNSDLELIIDAHDIVNAFSIEVVLEYDPQIISYTGVKKGEFTNTGMFGILAAITALENGKEELTISIPCNLQKSGDGELVRVNFKASDEEGSSNVIVKNLSVYYDSDIFTAVPLLKPENAEIIIKSIDSTTPTITITNPQTDSYNYTNSNPTLRVQGVSSDNVSVTSSSYFSDTGDSGMITPTNNWDIFVNLKEGKNVVTVEAFDQSGNKAHDQVTIYYTIPDTEKPIITFTNPTNEGYFYYTNESSAIVVDGTASDESEIEYISYKINEDDPIYLNTTNSWSLEVNLKEGQNNLTVEAGDINGNTSSKTLIINYVRPDTNNPIVTILTPNNLERYTYTSANNQLKVSGSANDNKKIASLSYKINEGEFIELVATSSWATIVNLMPGDNIINVVATDTSGNSGEDTITIIYNVPDFEAPTINITSPTSLDSYDYINESSSILIAGTAYDNNGTPIVSYSINDNEYQATPLSIGIVPAGLSIEDEPTSNNWSTLIDLMEGENIIKVKVEDNSGNSSEDIITINHSKPDTESPTIKITSPTELSTYNIENVHSSVKIEGIADDNSKISFIKYNINNGPLKNIIVSETWKTTVSLEEGKNLIKVIASDDSGNSSEDTLNINYSTPSPDLEKPEISITGPTTENSFEHISMSPNLIISGTAYDKEGISSIKYHLNGGLTKEISVSDNWMTTITLSRGENTITVIARDNSGNISEDILTIHYIIPDTKAPTVKITGPTEASLYSHMSNSPYLTIKGQAIDNAELDIVTIQINSGKIEYLTTIDDKWEKEIKLAEGTNTVKVEAIDVSGNRNSDSIYINYSKPVTLSILSGDSDSTDNSFTVSWVTNKPASSQVFWGVKGAFNNSSRLDNTAKTKHSITIEDLKSNTEYNYYVVSKDNTGQVTQSNNYTIRTKEIIIIEELKILNGSATSTEYSFTITWTTNLDSNSQIIWGRNGRYDRFSKIDTTMTKNHSVTINNLMPGQNYNYYVVSKDVNGNEVKSNKYKVKTKSFSFNWTRHKRSYTPKAENTQSSNRTQSTINNLIRNRATDTLNTRNYERFTPRYYSYSK